jgi:hypothetical protein
LAGSEASEVQKPRPVTASRHDQTFSAVSSSIQYSSGCDNCAGGRICGGGGAPVYQQRSNPSTYTRPSHGDLAPNPQSGPGGPRLRSKLPTLDEGGDGNGEDFKV